MTVCFVIDTPAGTQELYDRVIDLVRESGELPPDGHVDGHFGAGTGAGDPR